MNQRADSWKENLQLNGAKALIDRQGWLLSHTMRCGMAENLIERRLRGVDARFPGRLMKSASQPGASTVLIKSGLCGMETAGVVRTNRVRRCKSPSKRARTSSGVIPIPPKTAAMGRRLSP